MTLYHGLFSAFFAFVGAFLGPGSLAVGAGPSASCGEALLLDGMSPALATSDEAPGQYGGKIIRLDVKRDVPKALQSQLNEEQIRQHLLMQLEIVNGPVAWRKVGGIKACSNNGKDLHLEAADGKEWQGMVQKMGAVFKVVESLGRMHSYEIEKNIAEKRAIVQAKRTGFCVHDILAHRVGYLSLPPGFWTVAEMLARHDVELMKDPSVARALEFLAPHEQGNSGGSVEDHRLHRIYEEFRRRLARASIILEELTFRTDPLFKEAYLQKARAAVEGFGNPGKVDIEALLEDLPPGARGILEPAAASINQKHSLFAQKIRLIPEYVKLKVQVESGQIADTAVEQLRRFESRLDSK